ncbi:MAG: glycosyltransferase [Lentisphaerota bacterium]
MNPHIVQVITELEPAGAERVLANLSIELKKRDFGVTVISLQSEPSVRTIIDELTSNGIEVFFLNVTKKSPWRIFGLKWLIRKIKNDHISAGIIVHSHLMHANLACRFAKLIGQKFNLINTLHIAEKRQNQKLMFFLDKKTLHLCNIFTAVSKAAGIWHANKLGCTPNLLVTVYNGIKLPAALTNEKKVLLISEWGFQNCKKIIGSVGRLDWQKGYDIFLNLLYQLSKFIPAGEIWGVVILGEGSQRLKLEALAKNIPSNIKVILPGYRKDASECIGAFNLFVMPSRYEGFGLTLVEAMACGTPILASDADSLIELVKSFQNGKCIDFTNSTHAIKGILEYIQKPISKNDVSAFTVEKMADNYIKLYSSL